MGVGGCSEPAAPDQRRWGVHRRGECRGRPVRWCGMVWRRASCGQPASHARPVGGTASARTQHMPWLGKSTKQTLAQQQSAPLGPPQVRFSPRSKQHAALQRSRQHRLRLQPSTSASVAGACAPGAQRQQQQQAAAAAAHHNRRRGAHQQQQQVRPVRDGSCLLSATTHQSRLFAARSSCRWVMATPSCCRARGQTWGPPTCSAKRKQWRCRCR